MKIFRWESSGRVVEIAAPSLKAARLKASGQLENIAYELTRCNPDEVKECRSYSVLEDCVKTWKTH